MSRLPGSVLALLAAGALVAHALALPGVPVPGDALDALWNVAGLLVAILVGRALLSWLPPGEVGRNSGRELALTGAVSLLLFAFLRELLRTNEEVTHVPRIPTWMAVSVAVPLVVVPVVRFAAGPGAMVPRHRVGPGTAPLLARVASIALGAWLVVVTLAFGVSEAMWLALALCVFHALRVARRNPVGALAVLALGATCVHPADAFFAGLGYWLPPALSLGTGVCFLVPWLRRGDRRAGALAGIGFGSLFLGGFDPLAFVATGVFVLVSHIRQRRFAAAWALGIGAVCFARAWFAPLRYEVWGTPELGHERHELRRPLWGWVLQTEALDTEVWGRAWPIVLGALALGLVTLRWRATPWRPGTIEEPRREALAVAAVLAASAGSMLLPLSPWYEADALRILFAPALLLVGLLLVPPERAAAD